MKDISADGQTSGDALDGGGVVEGGVDHHRGSTGSAAVFALIIGTLAYGHENAVAATVGAPVDDSALHQSFGWIIHENNGARSRRQNLTRRAQRSVLGAEPGDAGVLLLGNCGDDGLCHLALDRLAHERNRHFDGAGDAHPGIVAD